MKLMGFVRGVTVLGGLPIPIPTVGHGAAYGIVGRNSARADGMREALRVCIDMARARQHS